MQVLTNGHRLSRTQLGSDFLFKLYILYDDDDDDDGKGTDDDDADDVNRTPTAFARRNCQQPESYKSNLQKHQAYHRHTGMAMIGPGSADSAMQRHKSSKHLPCHLAQNIVIPGHNVCTIIHEK